MWRYAGWPLNLSRRMRDAVLPHTKQDLCHSNADAVLYGEWRKLLKTRPNAVEGLSASILDGLELYAKSFNIGGS